MKHNIVNIQQSKYWNEKSGSKWVKVDEPLNERFSILTSELFSRANIKRIDNNLERNIEKCFLVIDFFFNPNAL